MGWIEEPPRTWPHDPVGVAPMLVLKVHHGLLHNFVEQVLILPRGQVETFPEQGRLLMLDTEPEKRPIRNLGDLNNFVRF